MMAVCLQGMILTALLARGGPVAERLRSVSAGGNIAMASFDDHSVSGTSGAAPPLAYRLLAS
jgi:hypothetical protein